MVGSAMNVTIRPLEIAERPKWLRMRKALFPERGDAMHAFEMDWHLAKGDEAAVLFAVDENGVICGFTEPTIRERVEHSTEDHVGYVEAWYIEPDARGRGVGGALMNTAENWTQNHGLRELASYTDLENADGLAQHLALGFEEKERVIQLLKRLG